MRSLLLLTGLIPAATSAQTELPRCQISEQVTDRATATTEIYYVSYKRSEAFTDFAISLRAYAYEHTNPDVELSDPKGAYLTLRYQQDAGALSPSIASATIPFAKEAGARDLYGLTLKIDDHAFDTVYDSRNNSIRYKEFLSIDEIGQPDTFQNDIELYFFELANDRGNAAFGYYRSDAIAAHRRAGAQYAAVNAAYRNGECEPIVREYCFLTTATCEAVGLDDDCWELRTLRRFRDEWLAQQEGGADDIATYYKRAPAIAEQLRQDRRAAIKLYWSRIMPSALAASVGANRLARAIYSKGMRELAGS